MSGNIGWKLLIKCGVLLVLLKKLLLVLDSGLVAKIAVNSFEFLKVSFFSAGIGKEIQSDRCLQESQEDASAEKWCH